MHFLKAMASALSRGFRTLMPTCREASRLQSQALDQPLSLPKRVGLRLHLLVCKWCRRYGRQIRFLRAAAHDHHDELTEGIPRTLSPEARERLKRSLRDTPSDQ
ncbi:MAG: hypothetical protein L0Z50_01495 [Verrucomicrobiales bacterium]|nr:hypothetical protein [Verrucomicrobiales bacterium]